MTDFEKVAILDFGSQYSQLIARRIREQNVCAVIVPHDIAPDALDSLRPKGIVLSGSPSSVYDGNAPTCHASILNNARPALGICYGMQLMSHMLGGKVERSDHREYGRAQLNVDQSAPLFHGLAQREVVWMSHGDRVTALPTGFRTIGRTANSPFAAMVDESGRRFGLQFHPEVAHTVHGTQILRNFLFNVCGCKGDWTVASLIETIVDEVRTRVGDEQVILGLSGGVDSSVCALLLHRAVGERLSCIFVDNGLLRKDEAAEVRERFGRHFGLRLTSVDAREQFLSRLRGVLDPEEKRRIIGEVFIRVFEEAAQGLGEVRFLAQGTLYPDVIESSSARKRGPSATIKTHHNVGGLPEDMQFELVEPLKDLFKDEVRLLGKALGLPDEIVWRHPFPGPGLAVRIIGEVNEERLQMLREADARFIEEMHRAGWYRKVAQAFVVLLPVRTVGVMGDDRTYDHVVAVRAVTTQDYMTADWARLPAELLARISSRLINEVKGINRVVYDVSSKPPSTIEWE